MLDGSSAPARGKRFFGRLRLCHQQREIVPANVVHVKGRGDADTVEADRDNDL